MSSAKSNQDLAGQIAFVGSFVSLPDESIHPAISQAGSRLQRKFIDFLRPAQVFSIAPIFLDSGQALQFDLPVTVINNHSPWSGKMHRAYRLVTDTIELVLHLAATPRRNVLFYNVEKQNGLSVLCARFLLRKRVYVIVADYAHYTNRLIGQGIDFLLRSAHGALVLNPNIDCNMNTKVLAGLVYRHTVVRGASGKPSRRILLSGSLGRTTGLELALAFFSKNTDYQLYLAGRPFRYRQGEFESMISGYAARFSNIHYEGALDYESHLRLVDSCDVALSLRDPGDAEHEFNFPSKILEYLSRSKLVVSTVQYSTMPADLLYYSRFDEKSIGETLRRIFEADEPEIDARRQRAYEHVVSTYTEPNAVRAMADLMKDDDDDGAV